MRPSVEGFRKDGSPVGHLSDETEIEALPPSPQKGNCTDEFLEFTMPGSRRRSLHVGDVIDLRYRLLRAIRESGPITVFVGENTVTGARVWIEHWRQQREVFRARASTLAAVRHRNAMRLLDALSEPMILVFELPRGVPLAHVIRDCGPFDYARALRIAERVCWGLHALQSAGSADRVELSAANIMLTVDPEMAEEPVVIHTNAAPSLPSRSTVPYPSTSNRDIGRLLLFMLTGRAYNRGRAACGVAELRERGLPTWLTRFIDALVECDGRQAMSAQSQASALHDLRRVRKHRTHSGWRRTAFVAASIAAAAISLFVGHRVGHTTFARTQAAPSCTSSR